MHKKFILATVALFAASVMTLAGIRPMDATPTAQAGGVLPAGWPSTLQVGTASPPGGASGMASIAPFGFRYQYLSGGANTGWGWAHWNSNGDFARYYIEDSVANGIVPVFTYYQIYQSSPGNSMGESDGVAANLTNSATMTAYFNDLKLFFQKAGAFPGKTVVLHVEPDMWGYMQGRSSGDNAATVPVKVGGSGMGDVAGFPDNAAGLAQAILKLRDQYAPNVAVGYHMSIWGTGTDIQYSKPNDSTTDALATRAGNFYNSLGADFDITFAEFSDRDAGFKQAQYGDGGASWFNAADFARHARFLKKFSDVAQERVVLWQIPLGNTKMQAQNNTWGHYQDNRVEWLFDDPSRTNLQTYLDAGVVAFLFGGGAGGTTCACDAMNDGVTNPSPINGNNLVSISADDDGGFFTQKITAYYANGAMPLSGSTSPTATPTRTATSVPPTNTPTRTATAVPPTNTPTRTATAVPPTITPTRTATAVPPTNTPTRTATTVPPTNTPTMTATAVPPTATATQAPLTWTTSATKSTSAVNRGSYITLSARVKASANASALVDLEVYNSSNQKVHQVYWDNQSFTAGKQRIFSTRWRVPTNLAPGTYTVRIGIFGTGWSGFLAWNHSATTFIVR